MAIGERTAKHADWMIPALSALGGVLLTLFGVSGWFLASGCIVLLAMILLHISQIKWREVSEKQAADAATLLALTLAERHSLLADTFAEIASAGAAMAELDKPARIALFEDLVTQAVSAITWLVHSDVQGIRAVVYKVDNEGTGLEVVRWKSRGHRKDPKPFVAGTDRAAKAFGLMERGGTLFVDDIAKAPALEWAGSGDGYNTFITSVIDSPTASYGLLTVDAPSTDDLTEDDENDLRLIAGILALLFAEFRRRNMGVRAS